MDRETRLGILASAILEGAPVDWHSLDTTGEPDEAALIDQLRIIADIAALHRSSDAAVSSVGGDRSAAAVPLALPVWGHLRLLELVGRGTYGEVYRAWDTHLDREVALKLLRTQSAAADPSASISDAARVVNEGRLLARVRHPHVITVYGAEPRDGRVGVWMEFIRGRTFHDIVDQQGPLGAREAAGVGADLCRALAAVHAAGLLHRDVSARNVMREDGGRVVLMDFGAGHDATTATRPSHDMTGTPVYMAPEVFAGARADQRTDIYAAGVLLYYLVSRRFPMTGASLSEIAERHRRGVAAATLRDVRPDLPGPFVRAVEKALARDPGDRFQTAGELETSLMRALDGISEPVGRTRPRRWLAAALALATGAATVAGVWTLSADWGRPSPQDRHDIPAGLAARRLTIPENVWLFSNPSDDGRFVTGMDTANGDAVLVDLATRTASRLGMGAADGSDGYASLGALSPDGKLVAIDWHDPRGGALRVAGTDGRSARVLIDAPGDVSVHQWSRDNRMILAVVSQPDGTNTIALVAASDGAVRPIRPLGATVPTGMSLSPDARYIVYDYPAGPGEDDHDVFVLDAHTGEQWPLEASPGHDVSPLWTPDGQAVVFLSDRNRNLSLWMVPMNGGRPQEPSRLARDNIGRVVLRGFTADGALHYQLWAGFAEVYLTPLDGARPPAPLPISPRQALSNFYPVWSWDGRYVAFASERTSEGRELWVYDVEAGREVRVPTSLRIGRPLGWSRDSAWILAYRPEQQELYAIERTTGRARLLASGLGGPAAWSEAGVVYRAGQRVVVLNADRRVPLRSFDYSGADVVTFRPASDGRSVISLHRGGRFVLRDVATGASREWHDSSALDVGEHFMASHTGAVAYLVHRKDLSGEVATLMFWGGSGEPRELLRAHPPDQFRVAGWLDDLTLLVVRWRLEKNAAGERIRNETLWRVPNAGGTPTSTGLTLEGLRDVSLHPNRRQIAFNAGWKRGEHWVMENLLRSAEAK